MARRLYRDEAISSGVNGEREPKEFFTVTTSVNDLIEDTIAGDWGTEAPTDETPVQVRIVRGTDMPRLQQGDFLSCPVRYISERDWRRKALQAHDVLVENSINAKTRPAGSSLVFSGSVIDRLGTRVVAASFCRVFRPKEQEGGYLLDAFLRDLVASRQIERYQVVAANGIANFQSRLFLSQACVPFAAPRIQTIGAHLALLRATTLFEQIAILRASRDHLLPRLISGELSVSATERELEAAA